MTVQLADVAIGSAVSTVARLATITVSGRKMRKRRMTRKEGSSGQW
jgi:hypothetical protein